VRGSDSISHYVDGKKLYEVRYDHKLLMKLLAGRNPEKYGEYKVVEVNWRDWDRDLSKLSPNAVKGCLQCCVRKPHARKQHVRKRHARRRRQRHAKQLGNQSKRCRP
jgi:hypothetical protein